MKLLEPDKVDIWPFNRAEGWAKVHWNSTTTLESVREFEEWAVIVAKKIRGSIERREAAAAANQREPNRGDE